MRALSRTVQATAHMWLRPLASAPRSRLSCISTRLIQSSRQTSNGKSYSTFPPVKEDPTTIGSIDFSIAPAKGAKGGSCHGRSVLLTGGSSGIGLAVAKSLVVEGAGRVLILTRSADRGARAVEDIIQSTGLQDAPVSFMTLDLTQSTDLRGPITQALDRIVCLHLPPAHSS